MFKLRQLPRRLAVATVAAGVFLMGERPRAADKSDYTFRSSVQEVRLVFSATDGNGHRVPQLTSRDIAVVDNGSVVRHFRSFRAASESPVNLIILVDTSSSVASQVPVEVEAAKQFTSSSDLRPEDRVAILAFGGNKPRLICARNCEDQKAEQRLDHLKANGLTPLYDAIFLAGTILAANSAADSRSAMIVFSDGVDNFSLRSLREAVEVSQQIEAPVYPVMTRGARGSSDGEPVLRKLAEETGGMMVESRPNEALAEVLQDLRSGFVLTYELPRHARSEHWVRILPTLNPHLHLRSRQSYREQSD